MALKLTLKPGEKFIINGAVIQNSDRRSTLMIQNKAAILREKDIMQPEDANTPMRRIYFAIMMMYLDEKSSKKHNADFLERMSEFMNAISTPDAVSQCVNIMQQVNDKQFYKALGACTKLYTFEEERLSYVTSEL
jgi:flagellar protein FlbT